jgi:hypothetical protein
MIFFPWSVTVSGLNGPRDRGTVTLVQNAPADSFQQLVQLIPYASSSAFSFNARFAEKDVSIEGRSSEFMRIAMNAGASPTALEELCPSARRYTHAGVG